MMERYYFWTYSKSYGWQQTGREDGYPSLYDLKLDYVFNITKPYKILKATVFESRGGDSL